MGLKRLPWAISIEPPTLIESNELLMTIYDRWQPRLSAAEEL